MDFRFGLTAIFLILDVFSIRYTDGTSKNSNKVKLSLGIARNPFLQPSINFPGTQNQNPFLPSTQNQNPFLPSTQNQNPFLPSVNDNKNGNSFLPFTQTSNTMFSNNNYNLFPNSINNPFLNPIKTDTRIETEYSSSKPVVQRPYTPPPIYYHNISVPNIPVISIPIKNDFINSTHTHTPPTIRPPDSRFPSLEDLIPIKINPVTTISERKCDEYVGEIAGTTSITSLTGSSSAVIKVNNVCENTNLLVVGGTETQIGEFPHMVALGRSSSEFILMCGGSLISHTWVLSAAHCTYGPDGGPTHARMGFHRLTDQEGITVAIKNMTRHPYYKPPAMYADIALVKLMNDITFSTSIRPACLYQKYDTVPRKAWISGWGVTEFSGEISDRLQKVELELVDNLVCTIRHNSSTEVPYGVTPSMICAGDPRGNWTKDSCQGDSGGPLQIVYPKSECLFQIIGITSFGQGCALIDIPSVYTRVSHYLPWIEDIVWPQGQ